MSNIVAGAVVASECGEDDIISANLEQMATTRSGQGVVV